jgi:hypothetical protein
MICGEKTRLMDEYSTATIAFTKAVAGTMTERNGKLRWLLPIPEESDFVAPSKCPNRISTDVVDI